MLTEAQYEEYLAGRQPQRQPHPLCVLVRKLRLAAGLSLRAFEAQSGIPAVVAGAYERGDRIPPLNKLEAIFGFFGYRLTASPEGARAIRTTSDVVADLRAIADQLESAHDLSELPGQLALFD